MRHRPGCRCGIDEAHHYDLEVSDGEARVVARIGPLRQCVAQHPVPPGPVTLTIDIRTTGVLPPSVSAASQLAGEPVGVAAHGPDTISFTVDADEPVLLAELDGRYLSTEVAAGFTGRVIGMYVTRGSASFDWLDYGPTV